MKSGGEDPGRQHRRSKCARDSRGSALSTVPVVPVAQSATSAPTKGRSRVRSPPGMQAPGRSRCLVSWPPGREGSTETARDRQAQPREVRSRSPGPWAVPPGLRAGDASANHLRMASLKRLRVDHPARCGRQRQHPSTEGIPSHLLRWSSGMDSWFSARRHGFNSRTEYNAG